MSVFHSAYGSPNKEAKSNVLITHNSSLITHNS